MSRYPTCPRCTGFIPSNLTPGRYPGALSRVDNITEICSACGHEEGATQWQLEPKVNWPVVNLPHGEYAAARSRAVDALLLIGSL
jgi:hypothetical protein